MTGPAAMTSPNYISPDYVDLQLRFAERVAELSGRPLTEALLYYTNFHRRLGLGVAGTVEPAPAWKAVVAGFEALPREEQLGRLNQALSAAEDGSAILLPGRIGFGCFACEAPNAEGMVRIHFGNRDGRSDVGPLHQSRIAARRAELTEMFGFAARHWPDAKAVFGASWLYNTQAYRRLFPAEYNASVAPSIGPQSLHGLSTWGQFIDFRGRVKPEVAAAFMHNLKLLDISQPWLSSPYQLLSASAPFTAFRREYGV